LVEDASDDEEISDTQMTVKNPIFLVTIEDRSRLTQNNPR